MILSLDEKKKASLDTLLFFHDYCEKNGLRYTLAYGTLIGAIRHRGFIPWDDDIDIQMPRPDYERLTSGFADNDRFRVVSCENNKVYMFPYAKMLNEKTARLDGDGNVDDIGLGIDLFPLDGVPEDLESAEKQFRRNNELFLKVISRFCYYLTLPSKGFLNKGKKLAGSIMLKTGILKKIALRCNRCPYHTDYEKSDLVSTIVGCYSGMFRVFRKEWFNRMTADFEGHPIYVPEGYDSILRSIYGDYMVLPPENERASTHEDRFIWR